jgi:hypothetical protein
MADGRKSPKFDQNEKNLKFVFMYRLDEKCIDESIVDNVN